MLEAPPGVAVLRALPGGDEGAHEGEPGRDELGPVLEHPRAQLAVELPPLGALGFRVESTQKGAGSQVASDDQVVARGEESDVVGALIISVLPSTRWQPRS